jgi:hypothetical protein
MTRPAHAGHPIGVLLAWAPPRPPEVQALRQRAIARILLLLSDGGRDAVLDGFGCSERTLRRWIAAAPELESATGRPGSATSARRGGSGGTRTHARQKRVSGAHSASGGKAAGGSKPDSEVGSANPAKSHRRLTVGQTADASTARIRGSAKVSGGQAWPPGCLRSGSD